MTALAVTGMIAATGLAAVGTAALTALADIAMGLGAFFMLVAFVFVLAYLFARWDERKHGLKIVGALRVLPEPVIDDALPLFFKHEKQLHVVRDKDGSFYDD